MSAPADRGENHLLAALPDEAWRRWSPHLKVLEMPLGHVLADSDASLSEVYFPTSPLGHQIYQSKPGDYPGEFRRRVKL